MELKFYNIIEIIAGFQFLLVAIFLINHKNSKSISHKILATFLLSKALSLIESIMLTFKVYLLDYPYLFCIARTAVFLYGPSLYFYTKSISSQNFNLKKIHLLHAVPFLVYWLFLIFKFHIHSSAVKRQLIAQQYLYSYWEAVIIFGFLFLQILVYIIASLLLLRNYQEKLRQAFSSVERINLSWLNFILLGFILIWFMESLNFIVLMTTGSVITPLNILSLIFIFILANGIVYRGLKQPEIFSGIAEKPKYETSPLTMAEMDECLKKLTSYMKTNKPYLNPSINIAELSKNLSIHPRYISQVINQLLQKNFYDFVNSYRIEEAKRYLANNDDQKMTILEILYEVGFNSKSAFNTAFKKHVGMTPIEYKKMYAGKHLN